MLSHIRLDEITEQDLLTLVENKVPESHTLEYKRETYKRNDKGKRELIKDIGAFANADGGDLIIGIEENDDGVAIALTGMSRAKISKEHERLEQIARSNFDPKIDFQMREILLSNDEVVLIFRIPASDIGPHRETFNGINRFHIRGSKTTDEPDVEGLRKMFLAPYMREKKIREFVDERIALLKKNEGPIKLVTKDWIAIHIVPLREAHLRFGYGNLEQQNFLGGFVPIRADGYGYRPNIDGVLLSVQDFSYTQLFRNGSIETACCEWCYDERNKTIIDGKSLIEIIVETTYKYIRNISIIGVQGPYFIFWTLVGVGGSYLKFNQEIAPRKCFDRDLIRIPEIRMDDSYSMKETLDKLRPSLDALWQAAGYERCLYFNDQDEWTGP